LKCKPEDIVIRMITPGIEAFAVCNGEPYRISTWDAIRADVADMLTHAGHAQSIDLNTWISATENTIDLSRCLPSLVNKIEGEGQIQLLHIVLSISSLAKDKYRAFWQTLATIDTCGYLLGPAIVSVTEQYNGDTLIDDITQRMITDGKRLLNLIQGGIFETVYLDDRPGYPAFYIYTADYEFDEN
jgi:hypothetical protein